jgi:hypothetical protein
MVFHSIYIIIIYILTNSVQFFCFIGILGVNYWQVLIFVSEMLILAGYKTLPLSFPQQNILRQNNFLAFCD